MEKEEVGLQMKSPLLRRNERRYVHHANQPPIKPEVRTVNAI
jgi:hypothetical protein